MKTSKQVLGVAQTAIALALLAAFNPAQSQEADLAKPSSWVGVGAGGVNGSSADRAQWGIYNGMRKESGYLLLDLDYASRSESGLWTTLSGRNLGLDNRELSFGQNQQGSWKYNVDFSEITRNDFRTINTGMTGIGSATPTIVRVAAPGAGSDVNLKTERKGLTLSGEMRFGGNLLFEASVKSEDKDGARQWGRGYDCAAYVCGTNSQWTTAQATAYQLTNVKNAILMVAEPINTNIKQWEAKLTFHDEKLAATAGYYGTFYTNANGSLNPIVPNVLNNGIGQAGTLYPITPNGVAASGGGMSLQQVLQSPMALPPDNQAHQFYVSGNYSFTPTAKATFKYAYTHATQDRSFADQGLSGAPFGASSLEGVIDTNLVQVGFTAKPIDKLSVLANWRYESKDDKTPLHLYNVEAQTLLAGVGATPTSYTNANFTNGNSIATWSNARQTSTKWAGKLEASYQFPAAFKATVGIDYSAIEREVPTDVTEDKVGGVNFVREKNSETGYRLELKKTLSEALTGAISYAHSKRGGSDWTSLNYSTDPLSKTSPISAANTALLAAYCNGNGSRLCYGQTAPASAWIAMAPTAIFPVSMTDLERDKWKVSANWNPNEQWSVQFMADYGKDKNTSPNNPTALTRGWVDNDNKFYSLDASFAMSEKWKLSAYYSYGDQGLDINHSTYIAQMKTKTDAFGLGLAGKLSEKLQIGANLSYFEDVTSSKFGVETGVAYAATLPLTLVTTAPTATQLAQAAIGVPDTSIKKTTLALFANYALAPSASVRFDLVYMDAKVNDWIWGIPGNPFYYADNTTVKQQADQKVTYVGAKYIYKWQ